MNKSVFQTKKRSGVLPFPVSNNTCRDSYIFKLSLIKLTSDCFCNNCHTKFINGIPTMMKGMCYPVTRETEKYPMLNI